MSFDCVLLSQALVRGAAGIENETVFFDRRAPLH
jgi:hypothetical protein